MTMRSAGWYPDPDNASKRRWWNGISWAENTTVSHSTTGQAIYHEAPRQAQALWNTSWIWLLVILPFFIQLPFILSMVAKYLLADPDAFAYINTFVGALIGLAVNSLVFVLCPVFSYLDFSELKRRGVVRPFHWAWGFLNMWSVYAIGRSLVVKKRTGKGLATLWVVVLLYGILIVASMANALYSILTNQ